VQKQAGWKGQADGARRNATNGVKYVVDYQRTPPSTRIIRSLQDRRHRPATQFLKPNPDIYLFAPD